MSLLMWEYRFHDDIWIRASSEKVFAFFEDMAANYQRWHPDHICFEWRRGDGLKEGNEFYFEERIAGQKLCKHTRFTKIKKDSYIEFTMKNYFFRYFIPKLTFEFTPEDDGCRFAAQIYMNGVGPIGRRLHKQQFAAVRQHMKEEGENLKAIIEANSTDP